MILKRKNYPYPYNMIIAFEGLDCSFKETNYKEFIRRLKEEFPDKTVITESFPRYKSEASIFVRKYLSGNDYQRSKLMRRLDIVGSFFALDRFDYWYSSILNGDTSVNNKTLLESGVNTSFIFDRYTLSNSLYNPLNGNGITAKDITFDFDRFNVPLPDIIVWMRMRNFDKIVEMLSAKENKDANELNISYLRRVWERSEKLIQSSLLDEEGIDLVVVECLDENGEIKSKEQLADDVWHSIMNHVYDAQVGDEDE